MQDTLENTISHDSAPHSTKKSATTVLNDTAEKPGFRAWCAQRKALAITAGLLLSTDLLAQGLPATAPPSRGNAAGNYIKLMQDYAYDIFIFLGLAVATVAFFAVSKNTIGAYGEVQDGKGTWGQVGMQFGVGVLLLVFVVFLLTEAAGVL